MIRKLKPGLIILALLLAPLALGVQLWNAFAWQAAGNPDLGVTIEVASGETLSKVASQLHQKGVLTHPRLFLLGARIMHLDRGLQLGEFHLSGAASCLQILRTLQNYAVPQHLLTIPEGLRLRDIAAIVQQSANLDSLLFMHLCRDPEFISTLALNPSPQNLEGRLFPDSYQLSALDSEEDLIRRMSAEMQRVICTLSTDCDKLDQQWLITLASIVQGEYQLPEEADSIASVYLNRLKRGMKLQADPTVQFLLKKPRRLLYADLELDSPYNTYKVSGLPPGPINAPGKVALKAVLFPAETDYLYFVADGTGKHLFARNQSGHLENRKTLDAIRRRHRRRNR